MFCYFNLTSKHVRLDMFSQPLEISCMCFCDSIRIYSHTLYKLQKQCEATPIVNITVMNSEENYVFILFSSSIALYLEVDVKNYYITCSWNI